MFIFISYTVKETEGRCVNREIGEIRLRLMKNTYRLDSPARDFIYMKANLMKVRPGTYVLYMQSSVSFVFLHIRSINDILMSLCVFAYTKER